MRAGVVVLAMLAGGTAPAEAMTFVRKGAVATASGPIRNGDEFAFRDFVAASPGLRVIYLDSTGGRVAPAREMARTIRNAGLVTAVDAARAACDSACTALFVAGTRRHYVNGASVRPGGGRKTGLGFHEGSAMGRDGRRGYSGSANAEMTNIYYEMGVPAAASLIGNAAFTGIHRISGQDALARGIATSLSPP